MLRLAIAGLVIASIAHPARAGDVTVSVAGGTLRLTGSPTADDVTIDQIGIVDPKRFRVTPNGATTVNGSLTALLFEDVKKDVRVELGGGTDTITVMRAELPRSLLCDGGPSGALQIVGQFARVRRDVTVVAAGQRLGLTFERSVVRRDFRIEGGSGPDELRIGEGTVIGGDVKFDRPGGDGDDLEIRRSLVRGDVTMSSSPAGDALSVFESTVEGNVKFTDIEDGGGLDLFDARVEGAARARFGAGDNVVTIQCGEVGGGVRIDAAGGANTLFMTDARVSKRFDWRSGDGDDDLEIAGATVIDGDASFRCGDGDNGLEVTACAVHGDLRVEGGAGRDVVVTALFNVIGDATLRLGNALTAFPDQLMMVKSSVGGRLGAGADGVASVEFDYTHVDGRLAIALGAGDHSAGLVSVHAGEVDLRAQGGIDMISLLADTVVAGNLSIRAGDGQNLITLFKATINGDSSVKAGSGDDTLTLNQFVVAGKEKVDLGAGNNVES